MENDRLVLDLKYGMFPSVFLNMQNLYFSKAAWVSATNPVLDSQANVPRSIVRAASASRTPSVVVSGISS